jgi:hypothetical protein
VLYRRDVLECRGVKHLEDSPSPHLREYAHEMGEGVAVAGSVEIDLADRERTRAHQPPSAFGDLDRVFALQIEVGL